MDLIIAFVIFILAMLASILAHVTMVAALLAGYICFIAVALRRGNKLTALLRLSAGGLKDAMTVVGILFFIGVLTARRHPEWRRTCFNA